MSELVRYDAACRAIADVKSIDEAKDIRDKSIAMAAYARQAKNKDLEADAIEIRMRATRRLDQLRQAQKETVGLNRGLAGSVVTGFDKNPVKDERPTLASQGIDKNLAHLDEWDAVQWDRGRLSYGGSKTTDQECIWYSPPCAAARNQLDMFKGDCRCTSTNLT